MASINWRTLDILMGISSPGSCGAKKTVHVRRDIEIVFSGSYAVIFPDTMSLSSCGAVEVQALTVTDENGNPMPAGTTIALTASGNISFTDGASASFKVLSSNQTSKTTNYAFTITSPTACKAGDRGNIKVVVTVPSGVASTKYIPTTVR